MTSRAIMQYTSLVLEEKEVKERIEKLQKELRKIEDEGNVKDKVMGGEGGWKSFTIEGFPHPEYDKKKSFLLKRMLTLGKLQAKIDEQLVELEEMIAEIDDSYIRRIVDYRVLQRKPWNEIANLIGGNNTPDSVRKIFERFIEKN